MNIYRIHRLYNNTTTIWRLFILLIIGLYLTISNLNSKLFGYSLYPNTEEDVDLSDIRDIYVHDDNVRFRIMVLTYNRSGSLSKTLSSISDLVLDGDSVSVHIWIDRTKGSDALDGDTYRIARNFSWSHGPVYVHVHEKHVGVYGQWIKTWRPYERRHMEQGISNNYDLDEPITLYVEDDIDLSPFAYRWLRGVYDKYLPRNDISIFCIQDENAVVSSGSLQNHEISRPKEFPLFLYQLPGSWGCAPHPRRWKEFQEWFHRKRADNKFAPLNGKAKMHSGWYKTFMKQGKEDTMWTMWYIYYSIENNLYCLYSNLPAYAGLNNVSLSSNRKEKGMHHQRRSETLQRLYFWNDTFLNLPEDIPKYGLKGEHVIT